MRYEILSSMPCKSKPIPHAQQAQNMTAIFQTALTRRADGRTLNDIAKLDAVSFLKCRSEIQPRRDAAGVLVHS
jgi:hypothetical protein